MTAKELYRAGKLNEAIQALNQELRNNPTDLKQRTFLFELLCFAGEYDRAEKHLAVLSAGSAEAATGALLYRAALAGERSRNDLFEKKDYPTAQATARPGALNGKPFKELEDADERVGARLEIFAAGQLMWIPFEHVASVEIEAPKRLRDLLWAPALVRTGPSFRGAELGEVLIPVLAPFSFRHADDAVRLGRSTVWEKQADGEVVPFGQKMLLVDGEEIPILEVRRIEITAADPARDEHATA
ncbi:MAG: type VI secretion system accessory protein TagJ [Bryobacteraceae bacterium]